MTATRITYLYNRWIDNIITPEEVKEFTMLLEVESEEALKKLMSEGWESFQPHERHYQEAKSAALLNKVLNRSAFKQLDQADQSIIHKHHSDSKIGDKKPLRSISILKNTWLKYAAIAVLTIGVGVYLFQNIGEKNSTIPAAARSSYPTNQEANKAILTLSDGRQILLDSSATGPLTEEYGMRIVKLENGEIRYEMLETENTKRDTAKIAYNTISTPSKGQYQIVLTDGTKVWLNAASSIRFPITFDKDRIINMEGEAYFEVSANKAKPFYVHFQGGVISVLGTSFNLNTYDYPEIVKTTLIEGAIKVNDILLKPGQAVVNNTIVATNTEQDIAWKSGIFDFNKVSLRTAMLQIANWYDVEIEYVNGIPDITFWGKISRHLNLSELLDFLERMGVQFTIDGRRITIENN